MTRQKKRPDDIMTLAFQEKVLGANDFSGSYARRAFDSVIRELISYAYSCIQEGGRMYMAGKDCPSAATVDNPWAPFYVVGWNLKCSVISCLATGDKNTQKYAQTLEKVEKRRRKEADKRFKALAEKEEKAKKHGVKVKFR